MAPPKQPAATAAPPFSKDEKVLCFHMNMLYEAKITETKLENSGWSYKIHYKGWKSTWDDWVPQDRVVRLNEEGRALQAQMIEQNKAITKINTKSSGKKGARNGSDFSSRASEERLGSVAGQAARSAQRRRDFDLENEDNFQSRPSVSIIMPDHIKAALVDDWENVTKNQQLVPIPHPHPVSEVLHDWSAYEKSKRSAGSPEAELLDEVVAGLKLYFDTALGRILLYRFERNQYAEIRKSINKSETAFVDKTMCDIYGIEHLCRLMVNLPELIAQTNMDKQSVERLREELTRFTTWLGRHGSKYFVKEYETQSADYLARARG